MIKKIDLSNGLRVSEVALGAMMFGTTTPEADAFGILDAFLDFGGNFVDTSNNYAHWAGSGDESEAVLGNWLRQRGCRDRVVLATKIGFDRHGEGAGLRKAQIVYWIEESLRKLNTDYVDLYYAHTDDANTPMEETMEAFDSLVKAGKVLHLGGSNYDTWRYAEANMLAAQRGWTPFTVMQQSFTYLHPKFEIAPKYIFNEKTNRERLRFLRDKDQPLVAYSSLCKGGYEDESRLPGDYIAGERLQALRSMAAEKGITASALAIAWMVNLHRCPGFPRVIPLFGSSVKHLAENIRGLDLKLTDQELQTLNQA